MELTLDIHFVMVAALAVLIFVSTLMGILLTAKMRKGATMVRKIASLESTVARQVSTIDALRGGLEVRLMMDDTSRAADLLDALERIDASLVERISFLEASADVALEAEKIVDDTLSNARVLEKRQRFTRYKILIEEIGMDASEACRFLNEDRKHLLEFGSLIRSGRLNSSIGDAELAKVEAILNSLDGETARDVWEKVKSRVASAERDSVKQFRVAMEKSRERVRRESLHRDGLMSKSIILPFPRN
jgi:hypothetical protein